MARYTDDSRDRVRDAVDMVDLVGTRVELRRAGVNRFEGLCPFHDERTPSFGINPAEKLFYCFGCGEGGDAFKFVQLTEGVDFKGSLEYLADRFGVELEVVEEDAAAAERRKERERLLELLERTAAFYVRYLWDSEEARPAREYLTGRGLEEGALREFRVGYAPSAWDKVLTASRRAGFSDRELVGAGLASRSKGEGRTYDRFRRRIMFPLCDARGRVLGFGARAMGVDQKPKYLNSSDNAVYHKGRHLFGADIARAVATKAGTVILVEGYTDVIAMHQAGLRNTVGVMGTALTDDQVQEIPRRLAPKAIIALDADTAGQAAMVRAARLGKRRGLEFEVAPLPPNKDPADLLKEEGARAIGQLMEAPIPFARFRVERELDMADLSSGQGKQAALTALSPVFAELEIGALRHELVRLVSDRTDLSPELTESLLKPQNAPTNGEAVAVDSTASPRDLARALDAPERAERAFLSQCLAAPNAGREALAGLDLDEAFSSDLARRAAAHVRDRLSGASLEAPLDDEALSKLVAELVVKAGAMRPSDAAVESERLSLELLRIERDIKAAQQAAAGDVTPLVARRQELRRRRDVAIARAMEETHVTSD
jgi:DNA primase